MEEKIEIMNLLQNKQLLEHELQSITYGSVEIRENDSNKYIYVHYREDGVALTKYVGENGPQVQAILSKVASLDVQRICSLHRAVLEDNLAYYID